MVWVNWRVTKPWIVAFAVLAFWSIVIMGVLTSVDWSNVPHDDLTAWSFWISLIRVAIMAILHIVTWCFVLWTLGKIGKKESKTEPDKKKRKKKERKDIIPDATTPPS